ncbi:MAG: hypothetical protein ACYCPQ_07150 [Elusimicrobiota bacterium]
MPGPQEFKPLKDVGAISVSDVTLIRFYVDEYRGYRYGSIRSFIKGERYSGPTKSGITMNLPALDDVIGALAQLPPEPGVLEEKELARIPKRMGTELVVRITIFKDATGIDMREWVEDRSYKGWSKKGVRIPYADIPKALGFLKEMRKALAERPRP